MATKAALNIKAIHALEQIEAACQQMAAITGVQFGDMPIRAKSPELLRTQQLEHFASYFEELASKVEALKAHQEDLAKASKSKSTAKSKSSETDE